MNETVSILIPCFNGELYVKKLFNTILNQTYQNMEIIFVNDGSTDNTEEIALSYKKILNEKGISFIYFKQSNKGQAAAINTALKFIHGKYVMWIDADDYLSFDHIEKKVTYLEQHAEVAVVMCKGVRVDEFSKIVGSLGEESAKGNLFEDILLENRRCTPGLYMVRSDVLRNSIHKMKIIESRVGQNFQLLLPITYKNNVGYINDKLFFYLERKDSHSHNIKGLTQLYKRINDVLKLKKDVLQTMDISFSYMKFLNELLEMKYIYSVTKLVSETSISDREELIVKEIIQSMFSSKWMFFPQNKKIFIWGACKKNYRLKEYMEQYTNIQIEGFIESVEKDSVYYVIKPEKIEKESMFIFVPLGFHQEIVDILNKKGFSKHEMCYLQYQIILSLEGDFYNEIIQ